MIESLFWGFVVSVPLMAGALLPLFITPPKSIVRYWHSGVGVLVAALSFSLVEEAFRLTKDVLPVIVYTANFILRGNLMKRLNIEKDLIIQMFSTIVTIRAGCFWYIDFRFQVLEFIGHSHVLPANISVSSLTKLRSKGGGLLRLKF